MLQFPFGGRSISGFVLAWRVDFDGEVKDILHLMDLDPVLSPEMIELGAYLSKKVHAFLIVLSNEASSNVKINYEKRFVLVDPKTIDVFREIFITKIHIAIHRMTCHKNM